MVAQGIIIVLISELETMSLLTTTNVLATPFIQDFQNEMEVCNKKVLEGETFVCFFFSKTLAHFLIIIPILHQEP